MNVRGTGYVQGGKASEISQVREALDAILSSASQRG
jgi:hypothetical protein